MAEHVCNPIEEVEAGGQQILGKPKIHSEVLLLFENAEGTRDRVTVEETCDQVTAKKTCNQVTAEGMCDQVTVQCGFPGHCKSLGTGRWEMLKIPQF